MDSDNETRFLSGLSCAATASGEGGTVESHYNND